MNEPKNEQKATSAEESAGIPVPRRGRIWVILALVLTTVALFAGIAEIATQPPADVAPVKLEGVRDAQRIFGGLRQDGDRVGDPDAPVTIQFFTDIQCGPCAEQFFETVPELVEELVRPGEAQMLFRNYSFSRNAIQEGFIAAEAAAEQGYLWQYAYIFFASQSEAKRLGIDLDYLSAIAVSISEMDIVQWKKDFEEGGAPDGPITESLKRQDEIALNLGLRAQPSVIVTGPKKTVTVQDSPNLDQIREAVDQVS